MKKKQQQDTSGDVRIDKWLWAARFYKTRRLATDAIQGGKVRLNGARPKPSKCVKEGNEISITQSGLERTFVIKAVSDKRGPAPVAQLLYEETSESLKLAEIYQENRKSAANYIQTDGRPTKKDRRLIHQFKQKNL